MCSRCGRVLTARRNPERAATHSCGQFPTHLRLPDGSAVLCVLAVDSAYAKSILVVAPHPDDEALIAAGIIRAGIEAGDIVNVAVMTNGDVNGTSVGYTREGESVAAMNLLGVIE